MEVMLQDSQTDLTALPDILRASAADLVAALRSGKDVNQAFSNFCSRAYVKADWAAPASEFLVTLFADHEDLLADMARIPDLIIELGCGQMSLTCMVAFRWASKSNTIQLAKLAEALAATHSKDSDPEVVHIMLALVTSLAITRYPRAEQMLNVAEPQTTEEHADGLTEAKAWLAAGRIIRSCSQECRELWEHRLRRTRMTWTWETPAERLALTELAGQLRHPQDGQSLFQAIVPPAWWELAQQHVQEQTESAAALDAAQQALKAAQASVVSAQQDTKAAQVAEAEATQALAPFLETPNDILADRDADFREATLREADFGPPPIVVYNVRPFFFGWLLGMAGLAAAIWIGPFDLLKPQPPAKTPTVVAAPSTLIPAGAETPASPAPEEKLPEVDKAKEQWRIEQAASVQAENADLQPLFDQLKTGTWQDHQALLSGEKPELSKDDPKYVRLLAWLHLQPPADPEIRAQLPALLAAIRPDSDTIDLWKQLSYLGSPLVKEIQQTARKELHYNKESWSASQEEALSQIVWGQ
jgi:hypothetical protein